MALDYTAQDLKAQPMKKELASDRSSRRLRKKTLMDLQPDSFSKLLNLRPLYMICPIDRDQDSASSM